MRELILTLLSGGRLAAYNVFPTLAPATHFMADNAVICHSYANPCPDSGTTLKQLQRALEPANLTLSQGEGMVYLKTLPNITLSNATQLLALV